MQKERRKQNLPAANQAGKIRAFVFALAERIQEARPIAAAVLGADDAQTIHRQPLDHVQADLVGKLRDVVEQNINRTAPGSFTREMFNPRR